MHVCMIFSGVCSVPYVSPVNFRRQHVPHTMTTHRRGNGMKARPVMRATLDDLELREEGEGNTTNDIFFRERSRSIRRGIYNTRSSSSVNSLLRQVRTGR